LTARSNAAARSLTVVGLVVRAFFIGWTGGGLGRRKFFEILSAFFFPNVGGLGRGGLGVDGWLDASLPGADARGVDVVDALLPCEDALGVDGWLDALLPCVDALGVGGWIDAPLPGADALGVDGWLDAPLPGADALGPLPGADAQGVDGWLDALLPGADALGVDGWLDGGSSRSGWAAVADALP
jgi:hypothetical protein